MRERISLYTTRKLLTIWQFRVSWSASHFIRMTSSVNPSCYKGKSNELGTGSHLFVPPRPNFRQFIYIFYVYKGIAKFVFQAEFILPFFMPDFIFVEFNFSFTFPTHHPTAHKHLLAAIPETQESCLLPKCAHRRPVPRWQRLRGCGRWRGIHERRRLRGDIGRRQDNIPGEHWHRAEDWGLRVRARPWLPGWYHCRRWSIFVKKSKLKKIGWHLAMCISSYLTKLICLSTFFFSIIIKY